MTTSMFTLDENQQLKKINAKLTNHAKKAFLSMTSLGRSLGFKGFDCFLLLYAIYLEKGSLGSKILKDLSIKKEYFEIPVNSKSTSAQSSKKQIARADRPAGASDQPSQLKNILVKSFSIAKNFNYAYVGTEHLVYAILDSQDESVKKLLSRVNIAKAQKNKTSSLPTKKQQTNSGLLGLNSQNFIEGIADLFNNSFFEELSDPAQNTPLYSFASHQLKNKSKKNISATPFLDKFCTDINEEVREKNETIIGRTLEIERLINILGRKNKNNAILLGHPGVGKTALVSGLALLINENSVPPFLLDKKIMELDIASLISGTGFRGEFETRLRGIIQEATKNPDIILFIDEIHNIVGAGNMPGSLDLANILKPALARGEMQLIGATTFLEYKKYIEKDSALERRFQAIHIKEPSIFEAKEILNGLKKGYESYHNVKLSEKVIELIVDLSEQYIHNRYLPDKAIDVLDETASLVRSRNKLSDHSKRIKELEKEKAALFETKENLVSEEKYEEAIALRSQEKELGTKLKKLKAAQLVLEKSNRVVIETEDVLRTISKISGVSEEKLTRAKNHKIKNISQALSRQVIGQREALEKISAALIRSQFGVSNPDRPLGSFLFLGPTGTGKTLTAKILAKEFFGSSNSLIKIDMSEFMERHSVSGLIGSPAGYIGYGEGGRLTEKVRHNPSSIILFDEIEKAHSDVHNILLQILEDGVLTDSQGLAVSFKNTIIILTSNIEPDEYDNLPRMGFSEKKEPPAEIIHPAEETAKELERLMRPELLNRLDHILIFNSLDQKNLEKIASIEIENLKNRLSKQGLNLAFDKAAPTFIAKISQIKNQGARLIRKNIGELLENKIARMIMEDKVKNNKITVVANKEKLELK